MIRSRSRLVAALCGVLGFGLLIGFALGRAGSSGDDVPADRSADAGFVRDMTVHHAQAVAMGETIRGRTDDADLALLAADIVLTQQAQIGRFSGWLEQWELPMTSLEPPMWWAPGMDHDMAGMEHTMPGMATPDQLAALETTPVDDAEVDFLTLMIEHHRGGVEMAEAIVPITDRPEIRRIAEGIIESQRSEITVMETMIQARVES